MSFIESGLTLLGFLLKEGGRVVIGEEVVYHVASDQGPLFVGELLLHLLLSDHEESVLMRGGSVMAV